MERSSKNENTCDIFMNEIRMEDEPLQEPEKLQVSKQKETKIKKKIEKSCMHKDYFGNQIAKMYYVKHFIILMITKKLIQQFLKSCIVFFCYNDLELNLNLKTQARRGLITYYTQLIELRH